MRVELERPSIRREQEFLDAARRSRALHRGLVSPPDTPEGYREYLKYPRRKDHEWHFVTSVATGSLVGSVSVSNIVRGLFQSAYLGYYAFVPLAGKGLMCEGLQLVINHCFRQLRLHRLEANIQPTNERSIALVRGLGFRYEGLSPRYLKIAGRWRDHERWALLAEEWGGVAARRRAAG